MEERSAAFAPGHVSGFFTIHDRARQEDQRGSRGAGVCLRRGAASLVEVEESDGFDLEVRLDREADPAPVTRAAVRRVLQEAALDAKIPVDTDAPSGDRIQLAVRVHTEHDMPVGQGFGMSGAGALAAARALADAVGLGRTTAVRAAHRAELEEGSGLGDVAAQIHGGWEIRRAPGLPPYGDVRSLVGYGPVVALPLGEPVPTGDVLSDPGRRQAIQEAGGEALESLLKDPSVEHLMHLSRSFADETGLMTDEVRHACEALAEDDVGSMVMLGNAAFAVGETQRIVDAWSDLGEPRVCPVAEGGVRLLDVDEAVEDPDELR